MNNAIFNFLEFIFSLISANAIESVVETFSSSHDRPEHAIPSSACLLPYLCQHTAISLTSADWTDRWFGCQPAFILWCGIPCESL